LEIDFSNDIPSSAEQGILGVDVLAAVMIKRTNFLCG